MDSKRLKLYQEIADSQKILREKYKRFRRGAQDIEQEVNQVFKPIIEPLHRLVDDNHKTKKNNRKFVHHSTPGHNTKYHSAVDNYSSAISGIDPFENVDIDVNDEHYNDDDGDNDGDVDIFSKSTKEYDIEKEVNENDNINKILSPQKNDTHLGNKNELVNISKVENDSILKNTSDKSIKKIMNLVAQKHKKIDSTLGVRKLVKGFRFGDSSFSYNNGSYKIGNESYKPTPGLTELLFKKNPSSEHISESDIEIYRKLVKKTNITKKNYDSRASPRNDNSVKYRTYLLDTFKSGGGGFNIAHRDDNIEYIYWDNPNELVKRLILLDAEKKAGNNNHHNEINSILEELRERGYL